MKVRCTNPSMPYMSSDSALQYALQDGDGYSKWPGPVKREVTVELGERMRRRSEPNQFMDYKQRMQ